MGNTEKNEEKKIEPQIDILTDGTKTELAKILAYDIALNLQARYFVNIAIKAQEDYSGIELHLKSITTYLSNHLILRGIETDVVQTESIGTALNILTPIVAEMMRSCYYIAATFGRTLPPLKSNEDMRSDIAYLTLIAEQQLRCMDYLKTKKISDKDIKEIVDCAGEIRQIVFSGLKHVMFTLDRDIYQSLATDIELFESAKEFATKIIGKDDKTK